VLNCFELVKPLFEDPLVEAEDLLVLSLTEGFHNFPLHAVQEDEDDETGPLILSHPIVYVPSLSVLHKCYWSRHAPGRIHNSKEVDKLRSLVLGGIVSPDPVFQYGAKAVDQIGGILKASKTTFVRDNATLGNLGTHISTSDVLHIHLHTNYGDKKSKKGSVHGHLSQNDAEDVTFVNSPLDQAIVFNGPDSNNKLTAAQIIELQLAKGAHFNLMACASGRQGTHKVQSHRSEQQAGVITDEVMGLVPAFLFSGAGSVTSTLWPIMDEHAAVFSTYFFRAFLEARAKVRSALTSGDEELSWIDLAEIHQKAVLEMRRIYKQPSAWAGFVLSGCWNFPV
jgi:CHAT domain-containing protein